MGKSRAVIVAVICVSTLLLPALLCLALALVPVRSALELALWTAAALAAMAALVLVSWWEFTGLFLRGAWTGLALAVAAARWAARPIGPTGGGWAVGLPGVAAVLLLLAAVAILVPALRARRHPGPALALEFPLRGGRFLVTDGGDGAASFLVNYHFGFGGHRGSGVSGSMRYATDVVEIGALGIEAPWLVPARNQAYRIWGRTVHAPCDGVVAHAVDEVEDNSAFGPHRPYGVGNQVVIRTDGDAYVVLGHLQRGSVGVKPGDAVRAGQPVGRAGNSGWTERPHLHFQAMRAAGGDWWHGAPLPMRFGGRFLVKNQVLRTEPPDEGRRRVGGSGA
jgi:hypothetical protein